MLPCDVGTIIFRWGCRSYHVHKKPKKICGCLVIFPEKFFVCQNKMESLSQTMSECYMYAYILGLYPYDQAIFDSCYANLRVMNGIQVLEGASPSLFALHKGNMQALNHFLLKGNVLFAYDERFGYLSYVHWVRLIEIRNGWLKELLPPLVDIVMQYAEYEIIHPSLLELIHPS